MYKDIINQIEEAATSQMNAKNIYCTLEEFPEAFGWTSFERSRLDTKSFQVRGIEEHLARGGAAFAAC